MEKSGCLGEDLTCFFFILQPVGLSVQRGPSGLDHVTVFNGKNTSSEGGHMVFVTPGREDDS